MTACNSSNDSEPDLKIEMGRSFYEISPGVYTFMAFTLNKAMQNAEAKIYMNDSLVQTIDLDRTHRDSLSIVHAMPPKYQGQTVNYQILVQSDKNANDILASIFFTANVIGSSEYEFVVNKHLVSTYYDNGISFSEGEIVTRSYIGNLSNSNQYDITLHAERLDNYDFGRVEFTFESIDPNKTLILPIAESLLDINDINDFIRSAYNFSEGTSGTDKLVWRQGTGYDVMLVHDNGDIDVFNLSPDEFRYRFFINHRGIRRK
ncbi:hypothetical protein [Aureibacter tunicatorum]|uniref:Uncharacterized protein n=1 Tax=Aureibacter tunicatorum TaxID=866807 RepID=A0AAE4BV77_9BACT|nr:hypothetical protein [Aureibacter tunicatorum]MDR6241602.1 hypothetical protein [Aureibacter tunicatorum]